MLGQGWGLDGWGLGLTLVARLRGRTATQRSAKKGSENRPALSGGMDWWRMEWPFSRVRKIFFRDRNFQEKR